MEKKRITVMVAGQKFTILTEEDEKYVIDIAAKADARIASLSLSGMSREKAAVLTALDYADDIEKQRRETAQIREQIKDYIENSQKLTQENERLKSEADRLKGESDKLRLETEQLRESDTSQVDRLTITALEKEVETLRRQLKEREQQAASEEIPIPDEAPVIPDLPVEQPVTTAKEEEFLNMPVEPTVKPPKKPRHEHRHENPYRQQFLNKQKDSGEQKGYVPRRQYSLFDDEE